MVARKLAILLGLIMAVMFGSVAAVNQRPAGAAAGDSVVLAWNQQVLDTIVRSKLSPTVAARALAVVHAPPT